MNCVYCKGYLKEFSVRNVRNDTNTKSIKEHMLMLNSSDLKNILPSMTHGKCVSCGSIIATDNRMKSEELLLSMYNDLPEDYWQELETDKSNSFLVELGNLLNLNQNTIMSICDVGCGDGKFLDCINESWQKFGVEPGKASENMINHEKITYFNGTLDKSPFRKHSMDIITYIDVFEHLADPIKEIKIAKEFLSPNGKIVIFTGNANSIYSKMSGKNWIYLAYVGHIAVASEKGLITALNSCGLNKIDVLNVNHHSSVSFPKWLFYLLASKLLGNRGNIPLFNDHMLVIASV